MRHSAKYLLERDVDVMRDYVLKHKQLQIKNFHPNAFTRSEKPVLFILSDSDGDSPVKQFPDQYILSNRLQTTFLLYYVNCDGNHETFGLCKLRSSDEGGIVMQPLGVNGGEQTDKLIKIATFDPEEIISLAYANIHLPEVDSDRFFDVIKDPTIVLLKAQSSWSSDDWEVLKTLPDFIRQHKEQYNFELLNWRPQEKRVVILNCEPVLVDNKVQTASDACKHFNRRENKLIVFGGRSKYQFEVYHGDLNLRDIGKFFADAR